MSTQDKIDDLLLQVAEAVTRDEQEARNLAAIMQRDDGTWWAEYATEDERDRWRVVWAFARKRVLEEAAALCMQKYREGDGAGKWYAKIILALAKEGT